MTKIAFIKYKSHHIKLPSNISPDGESGYKHCIADICSVPCFYCFLYLTYHCSITNLPLQPQCSAYKVCEGAAFLIWLAIHILLLSIWPLIPPLSPYAILSHLSWFISSISSLFALLLTLTCYVLLQKSCAYHYYILLNSAIVCNFTFSFYAKSDLILGAYFVFVFISEKIAFSTVRA
jgi:hypothetical protein